MTDGQVALYARVSSEQQVDANTIDSQVAALRARITADGFDVRSVLEFIDAGYSGSSLVRPALERLRDVAAAGGSTVSMCIAPIASRAITPIKSCCSRN
jgi:site-specific DNA recombinase